MKKAFLILFSTLLLICFVPNVYAKKLDIDLPKVTEHEKIKIYLFRGKGCTHCYDFLTFFNNHSQQLKKYIEIVSYETYKDNQELKNKVNDFLNITDEKERQSVPLIVVGNWHTLGFVESDGIKIIEEALKQYQNDEYVDEVSRIIQEENVSHNPETLQQACDAEGIVRNSNTILIVIFAVMLLSIGAIIFAVKKK